MKILMISQVFWPDTASVAQHMGDLAEELSGRNHSVTVFTSLNAYEDPKTKFPPDELYNGIKIERIRHSSFGKSSLAGRICDFFTFNFLLFFKMLKIKRREYDVIFSTTSPPLVSFISVIIARWKKIPFCYWTMDLQPELAIASGMIREGSLTARQLTFMGNYIIRKADMTFTLDHFMNRYLLKRGASAGTLHVLPVWPVMSELYTGLRSQNPFRIEHAFKDKTVIMYSGNHSQVHPLDTLLEVAHRLKENRDILFVFVGGGVRKQDVTTFASQHPDVNILQLAYQPRNNIHISLAAADIQVVIMGKEQVGFTHPNKIYGAMFIGRPILYIGPSESHVSDILEKLDGNISGNHGDVDSLTQQVLHFSRLSQDEREKIGAENRTYALNHFEPEMLKSKMVDILEKEFIR